MLPLSLFSMMMQGQQPGQSGQPFGPQPPQVSPQQRWFDMISRPGNDPNAPRQRPTNPYEALLNMTSNMGYQGPPQAAPQTAQQDPQAPQAPQPQQPNPAGIPDWMRMLGGLQGPQQVAPGQVVQQGQPSGYRNPQNGLNMARMGLGMMQPRYPLG